MQPSQGDVPVPESAERIRLAVQLRSRTDYRFDFWTALGWTAVTLGLYAFYILYRLVRRSRDHNLRRLEFLDAAATFAWEEAQLRGAAEELRPYFERIGAGLESMRRACREFRDPVIWLLLSLVSFGLTGMVAAVLLNRDLIDHDRTEASIEADLAFAFARLDHPLGTPLDPDRSVGRHNAAGRIAATLLTLGIYAFWWGRDLMVEGNDHFTINRVYEDDVSAAVQDLLAS